MTGCETTGCDDHTMVNIRVGIGNLFMIQEAADMVTPAANPWTSVSRQQLFTGHG